MAIRLCRKFTGGAAQALAQSSLAREDGDLVLSLKAPLHALLNESTGKDLRLLAEWLALRPEVDMLPAGEAMVSVPGA
jgi:exopolyphosphatase/guanosine-5'-triphosphate,3'-diphosphate pyrophosphatase